VNDKTKTKRPSWGWVTIPLVILLVGGWFLWQAFQPRSITTSEGMALISGTTVEKVVLNEGTQQVNLTLTEDYTHQSTGAGDPTANLGKDVYFTYSYVQTKDILDTVAEQAPAKGWNAVRPQSSALGAMFQLIVPLLVLMGAFYFIMRSMSGSRMMGGFTASRAKEFNQERPDVTFADVAGEDEAVEELEEIREFLASPDKFHKVGARIPRGVLLYGPPGTGKTLLAKAVAGEAKAPFFSISGSEFMELYVGVGASRVRELFERAKKNAPAIIFVDEIDAVGRHRGSGIGGGNDEREQTLNQLLVEMDGFDERANIILIAATNRPESLDPALLRPGRFDRRIPVELPDLKGREEILKVHAKKVRLADNVNFHTIARMASGASGAELANIINEAALRAVRSGRKVANQQDLEESVETVIAGYQKKNAVLTDKEKATVAYHEIGHALVAALQNHSAPVQKITIIPRTSGALGYTLQVEEHDKYLYSKEDLLNKICTYTAGRAAEEVEFGVITTGASNDIEQATKIARALITQYGMDEQFGMVQLSQRNSRYLGDESTSTCSEKTLEEIDKRVVALVQEQHDKAVALLRENKDKLNELAQFLYEKETITGEQFMDILNRPSAYASLGQPQPAL